MAGQDSQGEQLPARLFGQKAVNILRGWLQPSFGVKRVWMGWSWQLRFLAQTSPVLLTRRSWAAFRAGAVLASQWLEAPAALGRRGVPGTGSAAKPWDGHAPRPSVLKPPQQRGARAAACERVLQPEQQGAGVPSNTGSAGTRQTLPAEPGGSSASFLPPLAAPWHRQNSTGAGAERGLIHLCRVCVVPADPALSLTQGALVTALKALGTLLQTQPRMGHCCCSRDF